MSTAAFGVVFVAWIAFVYNLRKEQAFPVQKVLTFIPLLKGLEDLLYSLMYKSCPWVSENVAQDAYLRMGQITLVTFTYTFIHALFFMLCKGWNTTCQVMDRNQATNLTLVMGIIYLMYSAYFLSSDFSGMKNFVNAVLAFIYLILGLINLKSINEQLALLKSLVRFADEVVPVAFMQSIKLKYMMLSQFKLVVYVFFMLKFVMYSFNALN